MNNVLVPAEDTPSRADAMRRLHGGDVAGGRAMLRSIADAYDEPEDRLLLGRLAYVATDYAEAKSQLERAYHAFRAAHLPRRAAMAASALASLHADGLEEPQVGRGWLGRALRLLEGEDPCVEKGYVLLTLMGASVAGADELAANARAALEVAQQFADRALECKALGDWGLALVSMGRLRDGMAALDEACTMIISGECPDPSVCSQVLCGMLSACDRCGDVTRAQSWLPYIEDAAAAQLRFAAAHTLAHCWSAFGSVLCQVGRLQEGETALRMGLARGDAAFRHAKLSTRAALAELWIRQGNLDEAARLLDEHVDRVEIMGPRARLYLAQERYDLAAAVARQALRELTGDRLRAAPLLLIVVDAELRCGNLSDARSAANELESMAIDADVSAVAAQAALGLSRIAASCGDREAAAEHVDSGLRALEDESWPLLRAALHLQLALVEEATAPAAAIVAADTALSLYRQMGAPEARAAAELLRRLGRSVPPAAPARTTLDVLSRREREVLSCLAEGLSNPEIAKRLFITSKTAEHHVGSILGKLGLKNRAEAAAFAASFRISPGARDS